MMKIKCPRQYFVHSKEPMITVIESWLGRSLDYKFFCVVNESGRLIGTLTDGDLRRGLLQGISTQSPVIMFAEVRPIYAFDHDSAEEVKKKLETTKSELPFLPSVSQQGVIVDILVGERVPQENVSALLRAGGFGKRLKEKTVDRPKALVEVAGIPIIEHVFRKIEKAPIQHIYISVHHFADQINDYVNKTDRRDKVTLIYEDKPLGTAGALGLMERPFNSHLLVTNCDVITGMDFTSFCEFNIDSPNMVTVAVAQHQIVIPFGVVKHNLSGDFLGVEEKPVIANSVAAGISFFKEKILDLVADREQLDMPTLVQRAHSLGHRVGVFPIHEFWSDVGSLEELRDVDRKLTPD